MAVLLWRIAPILRNQVRFSLRTRTAAGRPSSGLKRLSDQDPVAGACRCDLPPRAAVAEEIARTRNVREIEDLDPRLARTVENDHPRAFRAYRGCGRS